MCESWGENFQQTFSIFELFSIDCLGGGGGGGGGGGKSLNLKIHSGGLQAKLHF